MKATTTLEAKIIGCHRGGNAFLDQLADARRRPDPMQMRPIPLQASLPVRVAVHDRIPQRADDYADRFTRQTGLRAIVDLDDPVLVTDIAAQTEKLSLLLAAIDDPTVQALLVRESCARVTAAALLIGAPDRRDLLGGGVIAFGTVFERGDSEARKDAVALFDRLSRWTGGKRAHSAEVRDGILAGMTFDSARTALYGDLAQRAYGAFQDETASVASGLTVSTSLGRAYTLRWLRSSSMTAERIALEADAAEVAVMTDHPTQEDGLQLFVPSRYGPVIHELPLAPDRRNQIRQIEAEERDAARRMNQELATLTRSAATTVAGTLGIGAASLLGPVGLGVAAALLIATD